jgi:peptide/nickel transport system permease protein
MNYWLQRILGMLATLLLVSMLTFVVLYLLPGDAARMILGTEAPPEALELLRNQLGLDRPLAPRWLEWLGGILRGDFGSSITFSRGFPVGELIKGAVPVTIPLSLLAILLSLILATPLGIVSARFQGGWLDSLILTVTQVSLSLPAFWVGILLIQYLAVGWGIFPPGGMPPWSQDPQGAALALVLPALALALPRAAILIRVVRTAMLDVLGEDYIRTARSKGLSELTVLFSHALRNALVSISTITGIHLVQLLAGTIVIEQVFSLPGLGRLLLAAVMQRDLPLVQGLVFTGAAMILGVNLLTDLLYPLLDPRITLKEPAHE